MENKIKVGGTYRHYKGKQYLVKGIVSHSETLEKLVLYDCLYDNEMSKTWVRPLEMFLSQVTIEGKTLNRFELID